MLMLTVGWLLFTAEGMDKHRPQLNVDKMLAENGMLAINYARPETAEYRAFMQDTTNIDKYFNDRRLLKFKPNRTFTAQQVIALRLSLVSTKFFLVPPTIVLNKRIYSF